jgi:hypothetical protein
LVAIYYLLPLDRSSTWAAVTMLAIGLVALIGLTGQMIVDLVTIGLAVKVIVGAAKQGRQRQPAGD